ncbi:hypothetical protein [Leptolyngbya sp. FACHB-261]|uniref:hypothetical protein n=1 Tax=Leptolyngbya sp. FACHB-261 TaxID=2692806 RepID=UPI001686EF44|nr:hypothetical protein [Leptolyngbya sp. FACHB-261]MBD2099696.1 hypothetical protein [Leptolyngbya sp. FACHB-261]
MGQGSSERSVCEFFVPDREAREPLLLPLARPPKALAPGLRSRSAPEPVQELPMQELNVLWARRYVEDIAARSEVLVNSPEAQAPEDLAIPDLRRQIVTKLSRELPFATSRALNSVQELLAQEILRQGIDPSHIDPWQIAAHSRSLLELVLDNFCQGHMPEHLSAKGSRAFGEVRRHYVQTDGRVLGFFSLQLHRTSLDLLSHLLPYERTYIGPFLKVMDDHINIPLQAAYDAAARHDYNSPALLAVRALLPLSSSVASQVFAGVRRKYPLYRSYSGSLRDMAVGASSLRDIEMFLVYLCLCVLEQDTRSIQQELFPLCVMLYPALQVDWELVQEMLWQIVQQLSESLTSQQIDVFSPYLKLLTQLFSIDVLKPLAE